MRFRPDLDHIAPYRPGLRPEEIMARYGVAEIARLSSNECPEPPFPEVVQAVAATLADLNRYPDNDATGLTEAIAGAVGVPPDHVMVGAGSNSLLFFTAIAAGGPAASAVYAHPSFALYRISTLIAGARPIEIPLDPGLRHDLPAMAAAVMPDTSLVYVCNPNNPTGTYVSGDEVARFVAALPEDVLVAVDEAYAEYATAADFRSAIELVAEHPNVAVYRTFSKVYGLAALRIGYMVARPEVIAELRKVALPFAVSTAAQAAALTALDSRERLVERVAANAARRTALLGELTDRGLDVVPSETNFLHVADATGLGDELLRRGVIVRVYGAGHLRITVGSDDDCARVLAAVDTVH